MAGFKKKISNLVETVVSNSESDVIALSSDNAAYKIVVDDLLDYINLSGFTECEFDNGSIASGTFTPDCDTNTNAHLITITGDCTIEVPTKTLAAGQMVESSITIINAGTHVITWAANWDFGDGGVPPATDTIVGFKRRFGDTKTIAWVVGS